jgi:putative acetyltransferase
LQDLTIAIDDPRAEDVQALVARHLAFANEHSPPEDVHALGLSGLTDEDVTFFTLRRDRELLGMGALRELDPAHGELKSMHTAVEARGEGLGAAMLTHLLAVARRRGYRRVSLETGSMAAFAPARRLYERAGFTSCEAFGDYNPSRNSTYMTLALD